MIARIYRRRYCRCRACGARQVKEKAPDEYTRPPRCRRCGQTGTLRIDQWADRKGWRYQTCHCDGQALERPGHKPWPHRRGSRGCLHYVEPIPDIDDFQELYAPDGTCPF
ncbi:hypothetical protein GCM10010082_31460 [Kushneria pakistanensis]|uniref:Uncharacterized protein n=1 Tax=Kushneria pakistanensis TaxID=1508770 RepID=A0ABQ3FQR0_9GAMM|nr:hypothetical protein GCM10010082_31460 [Kushneria pakistanensis]